MRLLLFVFLSFAFLGSCGAITAPSIKSLDSVRLVSVDDGMIVLKAQVTLENPNKITISGKELMFSVFYENTNLGKGWCPDAFELKGKELTPIQLDMELYLDSLPESLRMGLFEMDSIPLNMKLSFQGKLGVQHSRNGAFKLPMDKLQSALVNQYFSNSGFEMKDLKLASTNATNSVLKGNFSITNTLPFDVNILHSEVFVYSQKSQGVNVGEVKIADSISVKQGETILIPATINIDNMKAMSSGFGKILTGSLDYFAMGPFHVSLNDLTFKVPLAVHFSFNPLTGKVIILEQ